MDCELELGFVSMIHIIIFMPLKTSSGCGILVSCLSLLCVHLQHFGFKNNIYPVYDKHPKKGIQENRERSGSVVECLTQDLAASPASIHCGP